NDWIGFNTVGEISNADGFGAQITVTVDGVSQLFDVNAGSNFLSQNDKRAHFGLGEADGIVDMISVVWPSGITQEFFNIPANAYYTLHETDGLSLMYVIPEPSTVILAFFGAAGFGFAAYRRRKAARPAKR